MNCERLCKAENILELEYFLTSGSSAASSWQLGHHEVSSI